MNKKTIIMMFLKTGEVNAQSSERLAKALNCTPKYITALIRELRSDGAIILGDTKGYYFPEEQSDVIPLLIKLESKINELEKQKAAVCEWFQSYCRID